MDRLAYARSRPPDTSRPAEKQSTTTQSLFSDPQMSNTTIESIKKSKSAFLFFSCGDEREEGTSRATSLRMILLLFFAAVDVLFCDRP